MDVRGSGYGGLDGGSFSGAGRIRVDPMVYDSQILNRAANPAQVIVPVGIPINTLVAVNVWTR